MAFGSQTVTISTVAYIAESFSLKRGSNRAASMNQHGVENKQVFTATTPQGDLTLQLEDEETPAPPLFAEFTATPIGGGDAVTLIISEVGETQTNNGEAKVTVSVYKKLATA